jgi:hypothetical protein
MKNVSKLSLLIIAIAIVWAIFTVVLVATGHILYPLTRILLIGYSCYSTLLIIMLTISLDMAYKERNDAQSKTAIVVTKFSHALGRQIHELYDCPNSNHKYCKECMHRLPHEHTPECEVNGCEICVRVIN